MGLQVLLYWPNIVGEKHSVVLHCCVPTVLCAAVDGWLARRLGLTSRFAAWLDVAVDNLGRDMLWSLLFKVLRLKHIITHAQGDENEWKNSFGGSPPLVQLHINVLLLGFRTPLGVWVVGGLHCLPVWLYPCQWECCPTGWSCLCGSSITLSQMFSLQVWCIWTHIEHLEETKS
uniref:Uncharacterized protein n=1 Tax=Haplochromis burtoni TaxID=8153 RepID=A0A3Q3BS92_HAPBU